MKVTRSVQELDVYDIAHLAGGPARVVDTALVALVQSGRVRVHSPGSLATVALARRHPVEAAVLDAIGPAGSRSVDTIRWRLAADDRILEIGRRLRADGLASRIPVPRRVDRRPAPSRAGRRLLRELLTNPPTDRIVPGTEAMTVALRGRQAMGDPALRASMFEAPRFRPRTDDGRPGPHELEFADGWHAARRTRAQVVADADRLGHWMGG